MDDNSTLGEGSQEIQGLSIDKRDIFSRQKENNISSQATDKPNIKSHD